MVVYFGSTRTRRDASAASALIQRGQCWDACERRIHRNKTNCLSAHRRRTHWNVDDGMTMYVASTGTSMCWDACIRRIHRNRVKCLSAHRRRTHRNIDDGMPLYVASTGTLMPGLTGTSSRSWWRGYFDRVAELLRYVSSSASVMFDDTGTGTSYDFSKFSTTEADSTIAETIPSIAD